MSPSVSFRLLLTQSDERLAKLAGEGHERAFEALVQRYRRPLLAYCRRLLLPSERAEDALQQGLLQAWLALQNGCVVRDPKPWLYTVVHNAALNSLRSSGYDYATLNDTLRGGDAPEHDLDRRIAVREALAGLSALPPMQREALMRTALHGHSHEQVARALGLSEGALRGLVYRARTALRAATTALTPSPAISWALNPRAGASAPLLTRLAETGAGGGGVGIGSVLLKGGTVAITAGALAGGIATVHLHAHKGIPHSNGQASELLAADPNSSASVPHPGASPDGGVNRGTTGRENDARSRALGRPQRNEPPSPLPAGRHAFGIFPTHGDAGEAPSQRFPSSGRDGHPSDGTRTDGKPSASGSGGDSSSRTSSSSDGGSGSGGKDGGAVVSTASGSKDGSGSTSDTTQSSSGPSGDLSGSSSGSSGSSGDSSESGNLLSGSLSGSGTDSSGSGMDPSSSRSSTDPSGSGPTSGSG